jgi:D-alanyl-D-alanine carboxypeptidase
MARLAAAFSLLAAVSSGPSPAAAKQELVKGPYIVVDAKTGAVIDHRDAQRPWYPASTTKLMTAYVTFRALRAGTITTKSPVIISKNALAEPPSKMGFPVGTLLNIDNALKIIMVKSANDISVALAEGVAGSEERFISRMNAEARRLGMAQTRFANPHGLPDKGQVTSARDLAILARTVLSEFPEYREYLQIPSIRVGKRVLRNYNPLVDRYRGATGLKTGFICASGFNLAASAKRGGREIIAIVLGAYSSVERAETAVNLLDKGFRSRKTTTPGLTLAGVTSGTGYREPFNMRPLVCGKNKVAAARIRFKSEVGGKLMVSEGKKLRPSNLGKRRTTNPIQVSLGGTVGKTAGLTKVFLGTLPKPRPADAPGVMVAETVDVTNPSLKTAFVSSGDAEPSPATAAFKTAIRDPSATPLPRPRPARR